MSNENIVILARPHPFIAEHMKQFLTENGYTPFPVRDRSDVNKISDHSTVKGAIISTSLTSVSGDSYVDDFNFIRSEFEGLPIVFATLVKATDMLAPIAHAIQTEDLKPTVVEVNLDNKFHPSLGNKDTFLLVHKDSVAHEELKPVTAAMLRKHFGVTG